MCHKVSILHFSNDVKGGVIILDASEGREGVTENINIVVIDV
jgi:hypothetical protein